jgi:hypothetical protein
LFLIPALYVMQENFSASMRNAWDLLLGRPARSEAPENPVA